MEAFLVFGFFVGMGHALEADHLAAIGAIAGGRGSPRRLAFLGAAWGLGHTLTLLVVCSTVIFFGFALTDGTAAALEFSVGVMLVLLGLNVLFRMWKTRVHFHVHEHGDGEVHLHAHSHADAAVRHQEDPHDHAHPRGFPIKALAVGLVHGAAGSAALLALALAAARDPWVAILYVVLFGAGSICGMAALSFVAAWPLGIAERGARRLHRAVHAAISFVAISIGGGVMAEAGPAVWASL